MLDLLNFVVTPAHASRIDRTLPRTSAEASPLQAVQVRQPGGNLKSWSDRSPQARPLGAVGAVITEFFISRRHRLRAIWVDMKYFVI
jgi:hypothetical protein